MIPLRALITITSFPATTLLLIIVNTMCFLFERALSPYSQELLIFRYGLIPGHLHLPALLTSMFLHGGWMHLIGNMWFLWVFGSRIEGTVGPLRYVGFYLLCGIASGLVHVVTNLGSEVPTIGASGAIAGVMGGFLLLYPRARIVTLVFIIFFITTVELPAVVMLLYWFALQLLSGLSSFGPQMGMKDAGGVAWFAHVGGFLAGMLFISMMGGIGRRAHYLYR